MVRSSIAMGMKGGYAGNGAVGVHAQARAAASSKGSRVAAMWTSRTRVLGVAAARSPPANAGFALLQRRRAMQVGLQPTHSQRRIHQEGYLGAAPTCVLASCCAQCTAKQPHHAPFSMSLHRCSLQRPSAPLATKAAPSRLQGSRQGRSPAYPLARHEHACCCTDRPSTTTMVHAHHATPLNRDAVHAG